ncbi:MAG: TIGR02678 family protein [Lachnospiraceae bacterium]
MKELDALLNNRWILKAEDKELYYKVRDQLGEIRKFTSDKLGCHIIENALMVKLEKIPVIPESFMGIKEFTSKEEYAFLCLLLMFLEDKDPQGQFILSQLTEYVSANMPEGSIDWTLYLNRRRMIKVLRYAVDQGMIRITDGTDEGFMDDASGEVLYENTGASRYFMRNFSHDIMDYTKPEDFQESDWFEMDESKGIARRHRVYKRLLFAPGMYQNDGPQEDFDYLKNYGRRMSEDLERTFDCQVHIHRGSAFLMAGEDCRMGSVFPGGNAISDVCLLCFEPIQKKIANGEWKTAVDETVTIETADLENLIKEVKRTFGEGFTKELRQMPEGEFSRYVIETMENWMFLKKIADDRQVILYPAIGKLEGHYPKEYEAQLKEKVKDEKTKNKKEGDKG